MRKFPAFSLAIALVLTVVAGSAAAQESPAPVPYSDIKVVQFGQFSGADLIEVDNTQFGKALRSACGSRPTPPVAPLVAVFGGIVVDWLFSRLTSGISKRLQKRIAEHTASYSNPSIYDDMLDKNLWSNNESCLVMQRIECQADPLLVKRGEAKCIDGTKKLGLAVGIKLKDEGDYLRVLPIATQLGVRKAKHYRGDYVVATTFRVQSVSFQDNEGSAWASTETSAINLTCGISKDQVDLSHCFQEYPLSDERWEQASVLPKPPQTVHAPVFTVGEVGEPRQGLKGFAAFMEANGASVSGALSEAFKKKVGLTE